MKSKFWLLAMVGAVLLSASPVLADFYVIASGGKAGTQINSVPYTIDSPGLYCLAGNRTYTPTTGNAITVNASDVTIDLMGYCLTGPGKGSGFNNSGIMINNGCANVEIRNGSLKSFGSYGISTATTACPSVRVFDFRVRDTGSIGIFLWGVNNLVAGCSVMLAGGVGISVGENSLVKSNHVYSNDGNGIVASAGSTISGNVAMLNSQGIFADIGCTVTDNTLNKNNSRGMQTYANCTITRNTLVNNVNGGIYTTNYCTITNNTIKGTEGLTYGNNCTVAYNTVAP